MADVLKEFLVKLGYSLDEASERRMLDSVVRMTGAAVKLGAAVEAAAVGVVFGVAKIASGLEQLYFMSQRTGASIGNINAFTYAVSQLGGSAEGALSSLEGFAKALRNPGTKSFIESTIGHPVRDAASALTEFAVKAAQMPQYIGDYWAQMVGIDDLTWQAMRHNIGAFQKEHAEMVKRIGLNEQQAGINSQRFMNRLRATQDLISSLLKKIGSDLAGELSKDVEAFRTAIQEHSAQIQHIIDVIVKAVVSGSAIFIRLVGRLIQVTGDIYDWFVKLDPKMKAVIETIVAVGAAWYLLNRGFLSTPLGLIAATAAALLGLYDDYKTWKEGGKSLIDWAKWAPDIEAAIAGIKDLANWLKEFYTHHEATVKAFGALIVAWMAFNAVVSASPFAIIFTIAGAIAGLVIDFERWKKTGEVGLIDWPKWKPYIDNALKAIDDISSKIDKLIESVGGWQVALEGFLLLLTGKWLVGVLSAFGRVLGVTKVLGAAFGGLGAGGLFGALIKDLLRLIPLLSVFLFGLNTAYNQGPTTVEKLTPDEQEERGEQRSGIFRSITNFGRRMLGLKPLPEPAENSPERKGMNPIGDRLNNPSNLKDVYGNFRQFNTKEEGIAASLKQYLRYQESPDWAPNRRTIRDLIMTATPPGDAGNSAALPAYIASVAKAVGIGPDEPINLRNPIMAARFMQAVGRAEIGRYAPGPDVYQRGVAMGLGLPNAPTGQIPTVVPPPMPAVGPAVPPSVINNNNNKTSGDTSVTQNNNISMPGKSSPQDLERVRDLVARMHSDLYRYQGGAVR